MGYKRTKGVVVSLLIATTLSACNVWDGSESIDPPQTLKEDKKNDVKTTTVDKKPLQVTVYLKDQYGYVAPVTIGMDDTLSPAKAALAAMVEGNTKVDGFNGLLPKGTEVNGINIVKDEKLAIVDFNQSFLTYKKQNERKMLEAVTWTLTNFPTIEQVQIRVNGKPVQAMPAMGTPLDQPLTRKMGINVETVSGVVLSQAKPVTLYFQAKDEQDKEYLVPVTRMMALTDKPLEAVLKQLTVAPSKKGLQAAVSEQAKLVSMQLQNKVITVNVKDEALKKPGDLEDLTLQAMIMSLLDNSQATHVQVMVNDQAVEDKPVSKPTEINAWGL